jgi:hypothetical protein
MPGFVATCFNPVTQKTTTSDCDDLKAAQIRARTLRGVVEPFEQQAACIIKVQCPDGAVWEWRTVLGHGFWKEAGE